VRRLHVELAVVGTELVEVAGERGRVFGGDPLQQQPAEVAALPTHVGREHRHHLRATQREHERVEVADQPVGVVDEGQRLPDQLPLGAQLEIGERGTGGRRRTGCGGGREACSTAGWRNRTRRGSGWSG
jgi:hypothetical protein